MSSEQLFSLIKNCSSKAKSNLNNFFNLLMEKPIQQEESQVQVNLEKIFNDITNQFHLAKIREISKNQRSQKDLTHHQYNYGEITFKTIFKIISKIKKRQKTLAKDQIFYDLGSGSGKVLFAASLCHSFKKCKGIQYLKSLYETSILLKEKIEKNAKKIEEEVNEVLTKQYELPSIQIFNQDFQNTDWSDGTVIFVSSTCYTREVMHKISGLCGKLNTGTVLITLTRPIETNNGWKLIQKFEGETSWGNCTVYIHEKQS